MYGPSASSWSFPSSWSICPDAALVFSGVSLFRSSRWHGDLSPVSNFLGVSREALPLDLCVLLSKNFLDRIFTGHIRLKNNRRGRVTGEFLICYLFCNLPPDLDASVCGLSPKSDSQKSSVSGTHLSNGWKSLLSRGSLLNNCNRRSILSMRASNWLKAEQIDTTWEFCFYKYQVYKPHRVS